MIRNKLKMMLALGLAAVMLLSFAACAKEQPVETREPETTQDATQTVPETQEHIYDVTSIAGFDTVDADGTQVTAEVLKEHKLTLVNVLSSGCGPCMGELPILMKLSEEYPDLGFLGIDLDMDLEGNPDLESAEIMKNMLQENGGKMKIVFPDDVLLMQVLVNVDAMPYTFFVDEEGNVVGGDYLGARDEAQWREIIEKELGA